MWIPGYSCFIGYHNPLYALYNTEDSTLSGLNRLNAQARPTENGKGWEATADGLLTQIKTNCFTGTRQHGRMTRDYVSNCSSENSYRISSSKQSGSIPHSLPLNSEKIYSLRYARYRISPYTSSCNMA